ncbi:hydroxysqualene dehydroxylase HpnE [Parvularcula lutaonensis]|uniref:Hydroxysqualene dehydroxylase HpnE n=1 Tax=Parvularcula lutaonensis TaxID=491923 RepID=A0ABV7M9U1_9PROT|nr:hydroxysqualene dehydroxylase HpnE [Parvularcula lutaonensis]GGY46213.1 amine oxidase [Parvularcula lutaonensis]
MTGTVHIVGAGLAGLSTALHALKLGHGVRVYEGAPQAGGRCRTYFDSRLGRNIDNGNHLVLTGNRSVAEYLELAGAPGALVAAAAADFPFVDIESGERWRVRINDGPIPWWALDHARRPKGVRLTDMLRAGGILLAGPHDTIASYCTRNPVMRERFWEPMAMAVINLPPEEASARLMRATALEAWRDGRLARPMFAPRGLGPALIDPALKALEEAGCPVEYGRLLRRVEKEAGRATRLVFARGEPVQIAQEDAVVLALPAHRLAAIMPESGAPTETSPILNAHFLIDDPALLEGAPPILGVTRAVTQWIFIKGDIVSLTISAADHVDGSDAEEEALLRRLWDETRRALALPEAATYLSARLVREKRATFRQTPQNVARRPRQETSLRNLALAGDFVDTGLPATIEGAVRSGERAARLVC